MRVVILGATKGMGRALARRMAERGDHLFLFGRTDDIERSARDLEIRAGNGLAVGTAICDLERPDTFAPAFAAAAASLGGIDTVIVTGGLFGTQDRLEQDLELARRVLVVDFAHTVLFCEEARAYLLSGSGTLCVFSSVAGDRGRSSVVLYGAAKAGLTHYLEGLDHRYRRQGLRIICVKPGFVRTSMTEGLPAPPFAGTPEQVAGHVLSAIDRGTPVIYTPRPWALVMFVVRWLPRFVMRRVKF
jgi:NAD(P)-dependent dehydrogenase (short-subunit alcohol dehydrogenase family)